MISPTDIEKEAGRTSLYGAITINEQYELNNNSVELRQSAPPMTVDQVYSKAISGLVSIAASSNGRQSTSSGFLIDKEHIVTCAHCVVNSKGIPEEEIYVYLDGKDEKIRKATIIGIDGVADIALLKVDNPFNDPVPLRWAKSVKRGEQYVMLGTPHGDVQSVSSGIVRDISFYGSGHLSPIFESILLDSSALGGNSGGPILNMNGDVIGILAFGYDGLEGGMMNGGSPCYIAKKIVDTMIGSKKSFQHGTLHCKVRPMYISDCVYMGMEKIQGYIVVRSFKGSPLKPADIITNIFFNDKKFEVGQMNSQKCIFGIIHLHGGEHIKISVIRNGENIEFDWTIKHATSTIPQSGIL